MAAEQDRRSRMPHGATIQAPAKKQGAGGSYTWGNAMDAQYFEPVGFQAQSVGVVTAPAPTMTVQSQTLPNFAYEKQAFPTLGGGTQQVVTQQMLTAASSWGTPLIVNQNAATQVMETNSIRTVEAPFGQQQPRNLFAKKPHMVQRTQAVQVAASAQEGMIDWGASGIPPGVMQSIVQSNAAAAHLGPYAQRAAPVPLDMLRATNVGSVQQYMQVQPQITKTVMQNPRQVAGGIHQPGGR